MIKSVANRFKSMKYTIKLIFNMLKEKPYVVYYIGFTFAVGRQQRVKGFDDGG